MDYGIRNGIARIAVPFFFVSSGFFFSTKVDCSHLDLNVTKVYTFKLLRLLGLWSILLFAGDKGHLWYIGGLVVAVLLYSVLVYHNVSCKNMIVMACIFYMIGLIGDSYYHLLYPFQKIAPFRYLIAAYYKMFTTTRNGIFMGFPFFLMGCVIEKKKVFTRPVYSMIGFLVSTAFLLFEAFVLRKMAFPKEEHVDMYLFLVPAVFFLFLFSVNSNPFSSGSIYKKIRSVGVIVYFSHWLISCCILWGWDFVRKISGVEIDNSLVNYFLTITIANVVGVVIYELSRKEKFSFLKYLYS